MNRFIHTVKQFYRLHTWQGKSLLALSFIFLLLIVIRIALTPTIIYGTTSWLKDQGIDAHIEDISISFFDGTVSLIDAEGHSQGAPLFHIGLIDIHWSWAPLSDKTIDVTNIKIDKLTINIERYIDSMIIGGVTIPMAAGNKEPTPITSEEDGQVKPRTSSQTSSWAASLGEVSFKELNLCYKQHASTLEQATDDNRTLDYCVELDEMLWSGSVGYATSQALIDSGDIPVTSTGNFKLNGLTITDQQQIDKQQVGTVMYSRANELHDVKVNGLNDITIDKATMSGLSALQRDDDAHKDTVRFSELLIDHIAFTDLNTLSIDSITLAEPGIYLVKNSAQNWEYQRWIPVTRHAPETADLTTDARQDTTSSSTFSLALKRLQVSNPDMCYLDKTTELYYCYTQGVLNWDGSIHFSTRETGDGSPDLKIQGALTINNPKIRNHSLQRDLLDIDSIVLSGLDVDKKLKITLKKLRLDQFNAMQRGKSKDDFTTSFSTLVINDINYQGDSLSIDTITLDDLSSTISKNKDGNFEHDKWIAGDAQDNKTIEHTESKAPAAKNKAGRKLAVALNKLTVNTDKKISFVDNSTQPALDIGLKKLNIEVSELNPQKPRHDSPVKLFAKTSRHSTIDVEGTIRPFADKISFDIDGKLKGFDLRAATPQTKKTIGHIIKSGQMDADIKLLAKDDQLDSNIALSLYHFNIESMSKKDAEKLDKKFGMPLNQTLQLLRDKDDSIHLDIPVTGDINNPNFDPMDAIIKATSKAATVTLVTFYTPYGLIYAGGNVLFDLATAMNFDPVTFEAGESELDDKAKQQLAKLTELLNEKPGIHLTMCGMSNRKDATSVYSDLKSGENKTKLNDEQMAAMTELAKKRQENSKNYLIDKQNISHERLILCVPTYNDEDDAIGGVEINI